MPEPVTAGQLPGSAAGDRSRSDGRRPGECARGCNIDEDNNGLRLLQNRTRYTQRRDMPLQDTATTSTTIKVGIILRTLDSAWKQRLLIRLLNYVLIFYLFMYLFAY